MTAVHRYSGNNICCAGLQIVDLITIFDIGIEIIVFVITCVILNRAYKKGGRVLKVAVVGSRTLDERSYAVLQAHMPKGASEIISGGAEGADGLAECYAAEYNLPMTVVRPDYKAYDRMAPLIRNREIVEKSDYTIILWDGKSRGSLNVIMTCIRLNKPFKIFLIRGASR